MNSNGNKISFGFSKLSKKPNILAPPAKEEEKVVEFIDCLEGTTIKVKNAIEVVEKVPLVIPMQGSANELISQIEHACLKNKKITTEKNDEDTRPDSELTIEELAARQLLREARNKLTETKDTTKVHMLSLENAILNGKEPSSIDDYENVPIQDFGLAYLRGMGWKEGLPIGKNQSKFVKSVDVDLRPKRLGLGAQKTTDAFDKNGKKLVLAKGAFAKIVNGLHKGKFCEVQHCDAWTGRVAVKISNSTEIISVDELFVSPITKEDYVRGSRIINNAKYEQYKGMDEKKNKSTGEVDETYSSRSATNERHKITKLMKTEELSDDDISQKTEKSSYSIERTRNEYKVSSEEEAKHERRSRSREKFKKEKNSKKKVKQSKKRKESSESTESSASYDESKYRKNHSNSKNRRDKSEEYSRKSSRRNRSRSSSRDYDKNYRERSRRDISNKHKKDDSGKKKYETDSSKYSHKEKKNSRRYHKNKGSDEESTSEDRYKAKAVKSGSHRKRRDSSSDSDYSRRK